MGTIYDVVIYDPFGEEFERFRMIADSFKEAFHNAIVGVFSYVDGIHTTVYGACFSDKKEDPILIIRGLSEENQYGGYEDWMYRASIDLSIDGGHTFLEHRKMVIAS